MYEKLKKATKRIMAIGTGALVLSNVVYAGYDLGNYPDMFVKEGKFEGKVVVGAAASASDTTLATSIIDDLKSEFSGQQDKAQITFKKAGVGGTEIDAIKDNRDLNYGETIEFNTEVNGFDEDDVNVLSTIDFDNGISDERYEQTLELKNGLFNYALRDEVDDVEEISDNIFYESGDIFAVYKLNFDNIINLSQSDNLDDDMIGRELTIMGNSFTVGDIMKEANGDLSKLVLLGGSDKLTISEDEGVVTKVINGKSYEIEILSVSDNKVLVSVNGQTRSIDEYDNEEIGDLTIAVTDLASSARDAKAGYAEIIVGGQKVILEDNDAVKINDEDVDDIYDNYEVYADFSDGTGMDEIIITYAVSEDSIMNKGDSLQDVLFNAFSLVFKGTNEPDYNALKITANDENINFDGELENGNNLDRDLIYTNSTDGIDGLTYLRGDQDEDRVFFSGSLGVGWTGGENGIILTGTDVSFDFTENKIKGSGILLEDGTENQYLYEIGGVDVSDSLVSLDEILDDKDKSDVDASEFINGLEKVLPTSSKLVNDTGVLVNLADLGGILAFKNELMVDLDGVESLGTTGYLQFYLDDDVNVDDETDDDEFYYIDFGWDSNDEEIDLVLDMNSYAVNEGNEDVIDGSTDVKEFITAYGTKIKYDNDEKTYIEIDVPEEQVKADMKLVFGGNPATETTIIVDVDKLDAKRAELEEEGHIIVKTEILQSESVEFDVASVSFDSEINTLGDVIVVGGPAVNKLAADLLGVSFPAYGSASGTNINEAVVKYYEEKNSILVYGYEGKDTAIAVNKLNQEELTGLEINI